MRSVVVARPNTMSPPTAKLKPDQGEVVATDKVEPTYKLFDEVALSKYVEVA